MHSSFAVRRSSQVTFLDTFNVVSTPLCAPYAVSKNKATSFSSPSSRHCLLVNAFSSDEVLTSLLYTRLLTTKRECSATDIKLRQPEITDLALSIFHLYSRAIVVVVDCVASSGNEIFCVDHERLTHNSRTQENKKRQKEASPLKRPWM